MGKLVVPSTVPGPVFDGCYQDPKVQDDQLKEGEIMQGLVTMILAGGRGRRMDILCQYTAKPALPFAGTMRVNQK